MDRTAGALVLAAALSASAGSVVGCSLGLDLGGYRVAGSDAGSADGNGTTVVLRESTFRSYRFARGAAAFTIDASAGLSTGNPAAPSLVGGSFSTERGGRVELASDGSFTYTPPGLTGAFWGDDRFEYQPPAGAPRTERVRFTVYPDVLHPAQLRTSPGAGFGIAGASALDNVGADPRSFAPAGDVNGDGFEDFIVGAMGPRALMGNIPFGFGRGAYVIFGKPDGTDISLADLDGEEPKGFAILGDSDDNTLDAFGFSVAGAGDVNGDGFDDVIVGSDGFGITPAGDPIPYGAAYVVFGKADGAPVSSAAIRAGQGGGFALLAPSEYLVLGYDVAGVGDVNGDGLSDVVVGAPFLDGAPGNNSAAIVVFGKIDTAPVAVSGIVAGHGGGFAIEETSADALLGFSVAGVGDVNGDGLDDVAVGSPLSTSATTFVERTAVVFGKQDSDLVSFDELGEASTKGFLILGVSQATTADPYASFGHLSAAGDVNGDGLDDILVSAPFLSLAAAAAPPPPDGASSSADAGAADPLAEQGLVYVVLGKRDTRNVALTGMESGSAQGFVISGPALGSRIGLSVSSGDLNGDGLGDVVSSTQVGGIGSRAFVVFGKRDPTLVDLSQPLSDASAALPLSDENGHEVTCGLAVSGADANGDGLDDLLVSALLYDQAPQAAGGAYLVFSWDMTGALAQRDRALIGGAQADVFDLPSTPVVVIRGGNGTDTLRVGAGTSTLDLTLPRRYRSLEVIDVRGGGPQTILLDDAALRRIPQNQSGFAYGLARRLTILGDAEDTLAFDMTEFRARGGGDGRVVYGKAGAYYGLELSQAMRVVPP